MKMRQGFVSNSSSSSFIIVNKAKNTLPLKKFIEENPEFVKDFGREYMDVEDILSQMNIDGAACDQATMLKQADVHEHKLLKVGSNAVSFGDDEGTLIGRVLDYAMRSGGESENFEWRFVEGH